MIGEFDDVGFVSTDEMIKNIIRKDIETHQNDEKRFKEDKKPLNIKEFGVSISKSGSGNSDFTKTLVDPDLVK